MEKHYGTTMNTIRIFIIPIAFLMILSCKGDKDKPGNLLPEKQMKSVITDILIAKEMYVQKQKKIDSSGINPLESVFRKHRIDSVVFYNSLKYYLKHPETFLTMYKEIEADIKRKMDSLDKTKKAKRPENKDNGKNKKRSFPGIIK